MISRNLIGGSLIAAQLLIIFESVATVVEDVIHELVCQAELLVLSRDVRVQLRDPRLQELLRHIDACMLDGSPSGSASTRHGYSY